VKFELYFSPTFNGPIKNSTYLIFVELTNIYLILPKKSSKIIFKGLKKANMRISKMIDFLLFFSN